MSDPYAVLGLRHGATEQEAKEAFRKMAKTCHPDLHPNDPAAEQRFKEINAAYDAIRNPQPDPPPNPFREFRFGFGFGGTPFDEFFGDTHGFSRQARNPDTHIECRITMREAFEGKDVAIERPRAIKVRIPAGIEDGTRLRVPQAGEQINQSFRPGDLYLLIRVIPHPTLIRQGRNLIARVTVCAFDVLLGKDVEVEGIDGHRVRVTIPAGFDTTRRLRLTGQGMPDGFGRGDLLIELMITFPRITDEQRALIEQAQSILATN